MITLICTNCQATLEMDDAFAGGVCRCQHCGTIQTVPSKSKTHRSASPEIGYQPPAASRTEGKTLYRREETEQAAPSQAGLEDLASAVVSSGLSRKSLSTPRVAKQQVAPPTLAAEVEPEPKPAGNKKLLIIIGAAVAGLIIIGLVLFIVLRGSGKPADNALVEEPDPDESLFQGANFAGVPLTEPSIVYVLDRGNATDQFFDPLKASCYRSLELIGQDKKFAVILTDNGEAPVMYPKEGLASATQDQVQALREATQDIVATGNSHLRSSLEAAEARKPTAIVLATAKGDLDEDDRAALRDAETKGIKIYAFALGQTPGDALLRDVTGKTGGVFKQFTDDHILRKFANSGR